MLLYTVSMYSRVPCYVNLFLAFSNIAAIPAICVANTPLDAFMVVFAMCASFLMHMSERKHRLPGIVPFNRFAHEFLQLDRVAAVIVGIYFTWTAWKYGALNPNMIALALNGLFWMFMSEQISDTIPSHELFAVWHALWHLNAYFLMFAVLRAKNNHLHWERFVADPQSRWDDLVG